MKVTESSLSEMGGGKFRKWIQKIADSLPAPVDEPGEWIMREDFKKRKSFGFFLCKECQNRWTSAHSYPRYKQDCKSCCKSNYPVLLWKNASKYHRSDRNEDDENKKPHRRDLCEACKAGACDAGLSGW